MKLFINLPAAITLLSISVVSAVTAKQAKDGSMQNSICDQPKSSVACGQDMMTHYWNKDTMQCEEFDVGQCSDNDNGFKSRGECFKTCASKIGRGILSGVGRMGKGKGKDQGRGNGRGNAKGNGRDNGMGNGRGNGRDNERGNGRDNGRGNGRGNGRDNGRGNGRGNGRDNGRDNGKGNGRGNV